MPLRLGVNIDHVATLRQARYARDPDSILSEPDPVEAALLAEQAGADGITAHLREDRRHIQDHDIFRLKQSLRTKLNLEMGNTPGILEIALDVRPHDVCLVPENRNEVTTEGGLDCVSNRTALADSIRRLQDAGTVVSLFIDPDPDQIRAAAGLKAEYIELHTGAFANSAEDSRQEELQRLIDGARLAHDLRLRVNAGHGLNYANIRELFAVPHLEELNIGHSIVSRALSVGLATAVREMKGICAQYPV
ncbi:MAG: pyridoxine 5'-phosphate synthase [Chthoniobacterales bacterium]|nr:pyridoxine 5'-phosphate synthase [Chthoniobacterales bacterium]